MDRVSKSLLLDSQVVSTDIRHEKTETKMRIAGSKLVYKRIKIIVRDIGKAVSNVVLMQVIPNSVPVYSSPSGNLGLTNATGGRHGVSQEVFVHDLFWSALLPHTLNMNHCGKDKRQLLPDVLSQILSILMKM